MSSGQLFVCATPIGNLSDFSPRAIETLKFVDLIAAEDTRVTQKLCAKFDIDTPLISLQKFNEQSRLPKLLAALKDGKNIALVSDAGTPVVSDPGARLINAVREKAFTICPIPGPSAVITLLSASGWPGEQFSFFGFFPKKENERQRVAESWRQQNIPFIFFEAPTRIIKTLSWISDNYPNTNCCVGKELTKRFECILWGTASELLSKLESITIRGEWTLAVLQRPETQKNNGKIKFLKDQGLSLNQAIAIGKELLNLKRRDIYNAYLDSDD